MKIHVVCSNYESDRIIPRMFNALAQKAHFTISDVPDDTAQINLFSLYLEYPKIPYTLTKTAAMFSHYEKDVKSKADEWNRVAKLVDIRLYWSDLYKENLEQYGLSAKVTPFIDREKFNYE